MIKWFRRSAKTQRDADANAHLSHRSTRAHRRRDPTRRETHTRVFRPTGPSGGFDGNQEFITSYGDPFDG